MPYSLEQIARVVNGELTEGLAVSISEYCIDSRSLAFAGHTLFFALKGERHNGHDYIASLYEAGVRAFVVDENRAVFNTLTEANFIYANDVLTALQQLASHHRAQSPAEVIGITGSNGKTIVKEWLYQLLSPDFNVYRSPRSYNSQVGVPLSLLGISADTEIAIIEAGISQRGEMERLERMIKPDICIFTHLGDAHEENFSSREEKLAEKALLFQSASTIIGKAGKAMDHIRQGAPEASFLLWGEIATFPVVIRKPETTDKNQTTVEVSYQGKTFRLFIPFGDLASFENVMHAVCLLLYKNVDPEEIIRRVRDLSSIAMRMEIKEGIQGSLLINDFYNSDPASFQLVLNTMINQDPLKERTVILSDFVDAGKDHPDLYRQIAGMLQKAGVSRFIGIGETLGKYRYCFSGNARFYENTEQFLRQEDRDSFSNQVILIKGARRFRFEFIAGFLQKQSHGTILEVDLDAIVHNLNYFRTKTPARIAVMVKAFSYGSGSREIASLLQFHRVDYLMVAFADEGIELRAAGINLPIAVMNPEREAFDSMIAFNLEPGIYALDILEDFEKSLVKHGIKRFPVHIKLNTGMNRSGLDNKDLPALLDFFRTSRTVYIRSLFSHLAGSDEAEHDLFTMEQVGRFEQMTTLIQTELDYPVWRHILNSAGIERFPEYHFDMVRLGIGLHGIGPAAANLKPVSSFKTYISSIREVAEGEPIGYNRKSYTTRPSRIAIVPVGYADGLNRRLSNRIGELFVKGKRVPIIGNISMDSCAIDITDTDATIGDEVEIFGENIPVTELSDKLGTIPYEILTNVSHRVKRVYFKE